MEEEEDWDTPAKPQTSPKSSTPQQNNSSTSQITLKITDGYKYSYEALASPANIEDWIEPPTYGGYGGSRRSSSGFNGFSQNSSFRDNNKPFRNDRSDRFDSIKRNNNFSNSPKSFSTPKSSRFSNNRPNDWDAPKESNNQINGSWNANISVNTVVEDEDWDDPSDKSSAPKPVETPIYNSNNSIQNDSVTSAVVEESWDEPNDASKNNKHADHSSQSSISSTPAYAQLPTHKPRNSAMNEESWDDPNETSTNKPDVSNSSIQSNTPTNHMEESWDGDKATGNGFAADIPMFNPGGDSNSNSNGQFSNPDDTVNQRYHNSYHSNKYSSSNRDYQKDPFSRDSYDRHSRAGNRFIPYDRNNRGDWGDRGGRSRGGRGGRGGRGSRGSRDSSFNRSDSRNRGDRRDRDRGDRSYRDRDSFNRNNNRSPFQTPPTTFNTTLVEAEEDWDSPTGFKEKSTAESTETPKSAEEFVAPPVENSPVRVADNEESWD